MMCQRACVHDRRVVVGHANFVKFRLLHQEIVDTLTCSCLHKTFQHIYKLVDILLFNHLTTIINLFYERIFDRNVQFVRSLVVYTAFSDIEN